MTRQIEFAEADPMTAAHPPHCEALSALAGSAVTEWARRTPSVGGGIVTNALWSRPPRILVVLDDAMEVGLIQRVLESAQYDTVVSARDAQRAMHLAGLASPDLVLLDLDSPAFDSFAVLETLRRVTPRGEFIPVLILTRDSSHHTKQRALALGATDFLAIPFDSGELLLRAHNMLQTRLLHLAVKDQKVRLEETLLKRDHELEGAQIEMLERLALAAELSDSEAARHMRSVGEHSAALATAMGLDATMVHIIRRTAPLHDIGKIGTPDGPANPRELTPGERQAMREHTEVGHRILSGGTSPLLRAAAEIARHHHERWDGGGYPDGLVGAAIPLTARIVAVADVFDALSHYRPYRAAYSSELARRAILSGGGSHFDPAVVNAFRSIHPSKLKSRPALQRAG